MDIFSVGKMVTGWQAIGGLSYYFDAEGHMLTGLLTIIAKYISSIVRSL